MDQKQIFQRLLKQEYTKDINTVFHNYLDDIANIFSNRQNYPGFLLADAQNMEQTILTYQKITSQIKNQAYLKILLLNMQKEIHNIYSLIILKLKTAFEIDINILDNISSDILLSELWEILRNNINSHLKDAQIYLHRNHDYYPFKAGPYLLKPNHLMGQKKEINALYHGPIIEWQNSLEIEINEDFVSLETFLKMAQPIFKKQFYQNAQNELIERIILYATEEWFIAIYLDGKLKIDYNQSFENLEEIAKDSEYNIYRDKEVLYQVCLEQFLELFPSYERKLKL